MGFSGLFLAAFLSILLTQSNLCAAQTFVYADCSGGNFTANSTFQDNLGNLLSSISNNTSPSNTSFYETSVGREPDTVYGLFQCRGDYSPQDCKSCATIAAKDIRDKCPHSKESIAWYDECLLQYSNKSFATTVQFSPSLCLYNENNISNPDVFRPKRTELMNRLVDQAVNSSKLFAIGRDNFGINQTLYGLVQCTQEISKTDCERCLTRAVTELPGCSDLQIGGRTIKPSCNVRYETYDFIQNKTGLETPAPAAPLPRTGPPTNKNTTGKDEDSSKKIIVIIVPIVVAVIILFRVALFFCLRRKKGLQIVKDADEITTAESLQISFATVATATDNFIEANKLGEGGFGAVYKVGITFSSKIGEGGFGNVYKGTLHRGGLELPVAVKILKQSVQTEKQFMNEVRTIGSIHHHNLVSLLGYSVQGKTHALVYQFMENGSLDKYIYKNVSSHKQLSSKELFSIALGTARGILYLHGGCSMKILHCDIKPPNVLLDSNFSAKVADFGLAKMIDKDRSHVTLTTVQGTPGYTAPEVWLKKMGPVTEKSDVYSYGMLLLEIVGRRKNYDADASGTSQVYFPEWLYSQMDKADFSLLIREMATDDSTEDILHEDEEALRRMCLVGLWCIQHVPLKRPSMDYVIQMLVGNVEIEIPPYPFPKSRTEDQCM